MANKKILVVDDTEGMREMIAEVLTENGYEVVEAENALAALAILAAGVQPLCIVTDMHMPDMDGIELSAAIRKESNLPILLASMDDRAEQLALHVPGVCSIEKTPEAILKAVSSIQ